MGLRFEPVFGTVERAALRGGKSLIYVCPPAFWGLGPLWQRLDAPERTPGRLLLVPSQSEALSLAEWLSENREHAYPVTGLTRAVQSISHTSPRTLVATPGDTINLLARSVTALREVETVMTWSTGRLLAEGHGDSLDAILGECGGAQRIVVLHAEDEASDFCERHARRAPMIRSKAASPAKPSGCRVAVITHDRIRLGVRRCLDATVPVSTFVWDPYERGETFWGDLWHDQSLTIGSDIGDSRPDMAIATDLPDPDTLAALAEGSRQLVLLVRSGQLPWVPRLVDGPKTLRLFGEVDSARDRGFALRQEIRNRIESAGEPNFELSAIEPLLYDHDPAVIAAALAASISATAAPAESTPEESWVRVFLTVGKKDGVAAGNIVGALLNETGLTKRDVGRVDIRESHALVEIKSNVASRAVAGMNGVMLKGRRITARLDRK